MEPVKNNGSRSRGYDFSTFHFYKVWWHKERSNDEKFDFYLERRSYLWGLLEVVTYEDENEKLVQKSVVPLEWIKTKVNQRQSQNSLDAMLQNLSSKGKNLPKKEDLSETFNAHY